MAAVALGYFAFFVSLYVAAKLLARVFPWPPDRIGILLFGIATSVVAVRRVWWFWELGAVWELRLLFGERAVQAVYLLIGLGCCAFALAWP